MIILYVAAGISLALVIYRFIRWEIELRRQLRRLKELGPVPYRLGRELKDRVQREMKR